MKLGIIGGLGPLATTQFMTKVIQMTEATCDQEHLEMVVYNSPSIPDRTAYLLKRSQEDPIQPMIHLGQKLEKEVDVIAIPCITAHGFHDILEQSINKPIIHLVEEIAVYLASHHISRIGLMATDGTLAVGLFQYMLERYGIEVVVPDPIHQYLVMDVIYNHVKKIAPGGRVKLMQVADYLFSNQVEVIILGCTELSLVKTWGGLESGYLDALDILARASILRCNKRLKEDYILFEDKGGDHAKQYNGLSRTNRKKLS